MSARSPTTPERGWPGPGQALLGSLGSLILDLDGDRRDLLLIIGHLIPAGTGMPVYRRVRLDAEKEVPAAIAEIEDEGAKTA